MVASAGITLGEKTGWFGGLRYRYLGVSPLTENNAFRSPAVSIFNARAGYQFDNGWKLQLDVLNLFDAKTNQITYAYGSLIKTDNLYNLCYPVQVAPTAVCQTGVMDSVLHPIEPLAFRLTLSATFLNGGTISLRIEPSRTPRGKLRDLSPLRDKMDLPPYWWSDW